MGVGIFFLCPGAHHISGLSKQAGGGRSSYHGSALTTSPSNAPVSLAVHQGPAATAGEEAAVRPVWAAKGFPGSPV